MASIRCYCCGYPVHWKLAHNGHFSRTDFWGGTRFPNEGRIECACCVPVIPIKNGNLKAYEEHLIREYGEGIIDKLTMLKNTLTKFAPYEIEEMTEALQKERRLNG